MTSGARPPGGSRTLSERRRVNVCASGVNRCSRSNCFGSERAGNTTESGCFRVILCDKQNDIAVDELAY